ncbi:PRCC domain-containing protein [Aspergillus stella-maris]|uniref:PRCC domain-containing protein n=1 Tax=Aspergillus stella-maris TaxID=1810926 RepID=UPI003CCCF011
MVLVAYSDSEASDSEHENESPAPAAAAPKPSTTSTTSTSKTIVDKSNPRKIRVALPDIKPEPSQEGEDGPARKKPRIGGGGGAFAGFNSFLPAPKRPNATVTSEKEGEKKRLGGGAARKVFSLRTGAGPGFDRQADEEMRRDMAFDNLGGGGDDDETIPKAGSLRNQEYDGATASEEKVEMKKPEEVVLKGNPMMFKPLSVARTGQKKKRTMPIIPPPLPQSEKKVEEKATVTTVQPAAPPPKPKVSLFSLSSEETTAPEASVSAHASTYEPLVYTNETAPAAGPATEEASAPAASTQPAPPLAQTLDYIADDLKLSKSQRRQLFGRNADPSNSRILHFNTDKEYIANQEMAHQEQAATQHNPVRAIAPGKHTLQQLVSAASTQKEALEESFATGKRNKKEAGARYGW